MRNATLQKGLAILELMAQEAGEFALSKVAEVTGLDRGHTCRLLATLVAMGYVIRDEKTRKYRIGLRTLELSSEILTNMPLYRVGITYLRALSDELRAATYLGVPHLGKVLTVATAYPAGVYVDNVPGFGTVMRIEQSAMGKVLLAYGAVTLCANENGLAPIAHEIESIRRAGTADIRKHAGAADGIVGVAAPVYGAEGTVMAALGASVPETTWNGRDQDHFRAAITRHAAGLSLALGHAPSALGLGVRTKETIHQGGNHDVH